MFSNIREKYYAGADNDLHGGDGHVFPPSSSWLNLLQNSSNVGEKRGDATRPVRQQVGEREHPAIKKTLMMIMAMTPRQNNGEGRITRGHYRKLVDRRGQCCVLSEL